MLTGLDYGRLADMVEWSDPHVHYMRWQEILGVLDDLELAHSRPVTASRWKEIHRVAIVHVVGDHFILYDPEDSLFYDPGELTGPSKRTAHVPMSFVTVNTPP